MKLATLHDGTRDGQLAVVSRDLARAVPATGIAATLQAALDDWDRVAPKLAGLAAALDAGDSGSRHAQPFDAKAAMAPLPRAYQWADGSAYVNHVELVRKARGATMPPEFWTDPLMYQGASDHMLGAGEDVVLADEAWGIDFEAEVAVDHRRRADGNGPGRRAGPHPPADAGQRREPAQPHSRRTRQGLRLLPVEAGVGVLAGRGDAGRVGRRLARRQGPSAAGLAPQRRAVRPAERRRGHDLRLRPADRPRREDARPRRRQHHRFGHGFEPGARRPRPAGEGRRRGLRLHRRAADRRDASSPASRRRRSCASATACASRCSTATAARSSGRSTRWCVGADGVAHRGEGSGREGAGSARQPGRRRGGRRRGRTAGRPGRGSRIRVRGQVGRHCAASATAHPAGPRCG